MATEDAIGVVVGATASVLLGPEAAPVGYIFGQNAAAIIGAPAIGAAVGASVFSLVGEAICESFRSSGVTYYKANLNDTVPPAEYTDVPVTGSFVGPDLTTITTTCCESVGYRQQYY